MYRNERLLWIIIGVLVTGLGLEWFINNTYLNHSQSRNIFVAIQVFGGVIMVIYALIKKKK